MNPYLLLLLGAVAGSGLQFVSRLYLRRLDRQVTEGDAVTTRLDALEQKVQRTAEAVVALQTTAASQSPFFTELQSRLIDSLHHPDPTKIELDTLLEKLKGLTLQPDELRRLQVLLRAQAADSPDPIEQKQSHALLAIMPLVLDEAKLDGEASLREAAIPVRPTDTRDTLTQLLDLTKDIQAVSHTTLDTVKVFVDRRDRRSTDAPAEGRP